MNLRKIIIIIFILIIAISSGVTPNVLGTVDIPERVELVALEYHKYDAPPEVNYVGPEPRDLYYELHFQLQNRKVDTTLHNVKVNITDIVKMPIDPETGKLNPDCWLSPPPTSFGSNWICWYLGDLKGSERFWDWSHLFWRDKRKVYTESLGFSSVRKFEPKEIPATENSITQTVIIEVRPLEKDKVLYAGVWYAQQLITAELLEYNYKEYVIIPSSTRQELNEIEWRIEPPLEDVYVFRAVFRLARKPEVVGTIEVIPWCRTDLRTVRHVKEYDKNNVNVFLEDGIVRVTTADTVDWGIMYESPSKTVFFGSRERTIVGEIVLSGLSSPIIQAIDESGNIYFTEYFEKYSLIEKFNPRTKKVTVLVNHTRIDIGNIHFVDLDAMNNIYYMIGGYWSYKIFKLNVNDGISEQIYEAEDDFYIMNMDVDKLGNIYFFLLRYDEVNKVSFLPPQRLMMIPRGARTAKLLVEFTDPWAHVTSIQVHPNPTLGVFFTYTCEHGAYLYQYVDGKLRVILKKPRENYGHMVYMKLGMDGSLYYLYRQRSDIESPILWSYLEIGRFTVDDLKRGEGPTILLSERIEGKAVSFWIPSQLFFGVSPTKDVFFNVVLYDKKQSTVNLFWLNSKTNDYKILVSVTPTTEILRFVVDHLGNVYYSMRMSGLILRLHP